MGVIGNRAVARDVRVRALRLGTRGGIRHVEPVGTGGPGWGVLDGGRLVVYSDGGASVDVALNGNLQVKSGSQVHLGAHDNRLNVDATTLNGNIADYGPGTTGVPPNWPAETCTL